MFPIEKKYSLLPDEELEGRPIQRAPQRRSRTIIPLMLVLVLSLLANVYYMCDHYASSAQASDAFEPLSTFAELPRDMAIPYTHGSLWSLELAASDEAWEALSIDNGIVALSDNFVSNHGLLPAQRFPWDADKGIYVLNGFHNLHCLKLIRESLVKFQSNIEQSRPLGHILHCVDALRQDVICNADDTPRYTTITNDTKTGTNQPRQCRDWNKLEAWGRAHSACFSYVRETDNEYPNLNRFGFCPDESPYKETMERYFKHHPSPYARSGSKRDAIAMEPGSSLKHEDGEIPPPGSTLKRDGRVIEPGSTLKREEEEVEQPGSTLKREEEEVEQPGSTLRRDGGEVAELVSALKRAGQAEEPSSALKRDVSAIEAPRTVGSTL